MNKKIGLTVILLLFLSGCSGIVTEIDDGIYTVSEFDYRIERVDYAENISALPPNHICPAMKVYLPTKIYQVDDDTVCFKCKDANRSILNGWVEKNATACVLK